MHEEPGEIRFNQGSGEVAVEIDDEEPPSAYDIPAEISITRVNKTMAVPNAPKPFLKVRSDLSRFPPPHGHPPMMPNQTARHTGPPPLIRAGSLPPMPRLRLGGARPPMSRMNVPTSHHVGPNAHNPLASMFNMIPPNSMMGPPRPFLMPHSQMQFPPRVRQPPPPPAMTGGMNGNNGMIRSTIPAGASVLRPQHQQQRPPAPPKRPSQRTHHGLIPQEPLPPRFSTKGPQNGSARKAAMVGNKPSSVQVPPPLRGNEIATKVLQNGGNYSFPGLNITVTSAPRRKSATEVTKPVEEEEEEIDDDEEELEEELDDVEPPATEGGSINGGSKDASAAAAAMVNRKLPPLSAGNSLPAKEAASAVVVASPPRRRIGTLKFVRTADGKGYMRRQTDNLLQKAKATARVVKKKKRRFFRGGNYRFDGSSIKKRAGPGKSSKTPSEAGSDAQLMINDLNPASEGDVLSYLGIQRKGSEDGDEEAKTPKAKKSFRPSPINDRQMSVESVCSSDSLTIIQRKRKLEESFDDPAAMKKNKLEESPSKLIRPLLPLANEFEEKPLVST